MPQECGSLGELREAAKESEFAVIVQGAQPGQEKVTKQGAEHANREQAGHADIHRVPSREMPPPGTIMWMCG